MVSWHARSVQELIQSRRIGAELTAWRSLGERLAIKAANTIKTTKLSENLYLGGSRQEPAGGKNDYQTQGE
jgi:hypothetical protein